MDIRRSNLRVVAEPEGNRNLSAGRDRIQWRLSTMFIVSAMAAIVTAGFARQGVEGALGALCMSGVGLFGAWLMLRSWGRRPREAAGMVIGLGFLLAGFYGWYAMGQAAREPLLADFDGMRLDYFLRADTLWPLGIGGLIAFGIWRGSRPPWTVRIDVGPAGVKSSRGVPQANLASIKVFFKQDIHLDRSLVVRAHRTSNGYLMISYSKRLPDELKQQMRNFLNTTL